MKLEIGYSEVSERINRNPKFLRTCENCKHYYQDNEDKEELCQNSEVLEYDMVVEENRVYCIRWEPISRGL